MEGNDDSDCLVAAVDDNNGDWLATVERRILRLSTNATSFQKTGFLTGKSSSKHRSGDKTSSADVRSESAEVAFLIGTIKSDDDWRFVDAAARAGSCERKKGVVDAINIRLRKLSVSDW